MDQEPTILTITLCHSVVRMLGGKHERAWCSIRYEGALVYKMLMACFMGTSYSNRHQLNGAGFGRGVHMTGLGQCSGFKIGP